MKKALDIITTTLLIVVIIFAVLLVGVRLFGLEPYTVISGSMEPEYHVGSLIYVKKTTVDELEVNMPITYHMENGIVVTHRIIEVITDENTGAVKYVTKGDANDDIDGTPVTFERIIGRPVFHIPVLGYISYFVQNPPGIYIAILVIALLMMLTFMPDIILGILASENGAKQSGEKEEQSEAELMAEIEALRESIKKQETETDTESAAEQAPAEDSENSN